MQTVTLKLSNIELLAMRAALADYAVLAYRHGRDCQALGVREMARGWTAAEVAAVDLLSQLPPAPMAHLAAPR